MNTPSQHPEKIFAAAFSFALLLLIGHGANRVIADSWALPREFEVFTARNDYVAIVTPAPLLSKAISPRLTLFKVENDIRSEQWKTDLSNQVCPVNVLLSDDGEFAVTLDNWHSLGYGDNVVAIYNRAGLIKKYSLEAAVADFFAARGDVRFWDLFRHSVS